MHHLYLLISLPVLIGVIGWLVSKYHHGGVFHWKELAVQAGVGILLAGIGFSAAMCHRTSDTEIWNGRIAKKWKGTSGCCHSYQCNPHPCNCDDKGNCSTCWDTCYEHAADDAYYAETTNAEIAYGMKCVRPGSRAPARWSAIKVGEPTAIEHPYTNYLKGNPDSVLRRQGVKKAYEGLLPDYPRVRDHYRVTRALGMGVALPDADRLDAALDELNADLGARKQVNVILVVVRTGDRGYLHALEEHWLGGKKNDAVVIIGAPDFPRIAWAGVMSWSDAEEMKIMVRDRIEALDAFDGDAVIGILREEIGSKFVRKPMSDFEYLRATLSPSEGWLWFLYLFGLALALGLQFYFWKEDPFGEEIRTSRRRRTW